MNKISVKLKKNGLKKMKLLTFLLISNAAFYLCFFCPIFQFQKTPKKRVINRLVEVKEINSGSIEFESEEEYESH